MSAFGGIMYFDKSRTVEPSLLSLIASSLENSGPDNCRLYHSGSAGFLYRAFHTTAESRIEEQPTVDKHLVFMLDGRIDNSDELQKLLHVNARTDVDIFIASYKAWGSQCFRRILGDFAAAVWNSESRELTLARDPFGVRKVFYVKDDHKLVFATDIAALLDVPGVSQQIDEDFIGLSLAYLPDGTCTPFQCIKPVTPGHYLMFGDKISSQQYWGVESCITAGSMNRGDLEEELRHLLSRSIRACLRSDRPVTAELSGGLDSSTIVCVADALINSSNGSLPSLNTLSFVYDKAQQSDERAFISVVEAQRGRSGSHIKEDDDPILSRWPDRRFRQYPNRVHCFGGAVQGVYKAMGTLDSRVLLSGLFGDQLFISSHMLPFDAVDLVRARSYRQALKTCVDWSFETGQPLIQVLWHGAIRPNLPFWLRRAHLQRGRGPRNSPSSFAIPSWIDPGFIKRTNLKQRIHRLVDRDAELNAGSRGIRYANLMDCVGWFGSGYSQNQTGYDRIEMRYPYLHRPLVEFLISLPYREHCNERSSRSLQRESMKSIVPEPVRTRTDKKGPHQAILFAAKREQKFLRSLIEDSRACQRGYARKTELLEEADRWRNGQSVSDLLPFVAVEMWLRALDTGTEAEQHCYS